jgi:Caspase domain
MNSSGFLKLYRFFLAVGLLLVCQPALAEKRVALVLANSAYQNVAALPNPVNDGEMIAATLKEAGFDVVDSRHNLPALETRRALRDFADRARDADIAVVYYAGHGLEVDGTNYLIPVDAKLERDTDVYDEAFSLDRVLLAIEPAKQLRLVILDACRDNPFAKVMKRTVASRAIGRGLAKVEPTSPNTLIAYSAKAGSTALDGDKNSPFTTALAKHLTTPGLDVRRAFGFVRDDVLKNTSNRQEPFVYGSLGGDDMPLVPIKAAPSTSASNPQAEVRQDYELAQQIGNKAALNAFLAQYPDGFYADLARSQLAKIAADSGQKPQQVDAPSANKASESKVAVNSATADQATAGPSTAAKPQGERATNLASLNPGPTQADIAKSVQTELRRVGCLNAAADGEWNAASQRSLALFNRYAGTKFDVKLASIDTLDAIKLKSSRVCPLICEHGFKADGDRCGKIVCSEGSFVNDDNECEKRREKKPVAMRDSNDRPVRADRPVGERSAPAAGIPRPQASARSQAGGGSSGQIYCDVTSCRPVSRGCHLEYRGGGGYGGGTGNVEVCH